MCREGINSGIWGDERDRRSGDERVMISVERRPLSAEGRALEWWLSENGAVVPRRAGLTRRLCFRAQRAVESAFESDGVARSRVSKVTPKSRERDAMLGRFSTLNAQRSTLPS